MCALALLGIGACGGGQNENTANQPTYSDISTCLESAGAEVEPLASESEGELIGAQAPDGEVILILNLPDSDLAREAKPVLRNALHASLGQGRIRISSANEGTTLIGVVGSAAIDHGAPSPAAQRLATNCATAGNNSAAA
jgi:hypothetical protein